MTWMPLSVLRKAIFHRQTNGPLYSGLFVFYTLKCDKESGIIEKEKCPAVG